MTIEQLSSELERLLDAPGVTVPALLYGLAAACGDKAEHIRTNWQDESLAKAWDHAQRRVERLADSLAARA